MGKAAPTTVTMNLPWKVYGPDLNGSYGGLQGTGGLEATILDSNGTATGVLNDYFGNAVATVYGGSVTWNTTKVGGYGPLPDSSAQPLTDATQLAQAIVWRGHRIDPTGFYYLGARYYEPTSGRFLSPDPKGQAASMSLYDFCNGDPVNGFDPDGRCNDFYNGLPNYRDFIGPGDGVNISNTAPNSTSDGQNTDTGAGWFGFKNLFDSLRGPSGGIANYSYANDADKDCVPTSIRTTIATETSTNQSIGPIRDDVAALQGTPNQDWTKTGVQTSMVPEIVLYELSLHNISSTASSNDSGFLSIPSPFGNVPVTDPYTETANIMKTNGPSTVVGDLSNGTTTSSHAITTQYQGGANIVVDNFDGYGGSINVPVKEFQSGTITSGNSTFTLNTDVPVVTATGIIHRP
jgi:RHS repeat-associated protein